LYQEVLKHSRTNDKGEWFEKRDDTLPIAGTNIVDLISYAVKLGTSKPYGWNAFVEFLKVKKNIPRTLLTKRVRDSLSEPPEVPLSGGEVTTKTQSTSLRPSRSTTKKVIPPPPPPLPAAPTTPPQSAYHTPDGSPMRPPTLPGSAPFSAPLHVFKKLTRSKRKRKQNEQQQSGNGLKIYF
jgi:hypothetical protein